ncbi:MAG TPA: efflux RND transporter periplasmic adaptor subunit [Cellvibrionaceae bacterium]
MTKRMIIMLVAVGIVFGGIFGFKFWLGGFLNNMFDNMPMPVATITATHVTEDNWTPEATAVGSFRAINGAELTTQANGIVVGIHFDNGDEVTEGQRLISLDTSTDEADLERLQAAEKLASLELGRYQQLHKEGNISESELQRRQSEADQATATVRAQQARINQKVIRAPFDGISGIRQVNLGQYVSAGSSVVAVQSLDPIYLNFTLPEQQLSSVRTGQSMRVRVDAYPDQSFTGVITAIEPGINESTRTFTVQATLDNPELMLRPGMFGRVSMDRGEPQHVLLIPQTAIQFNPYGNSVFVIREEDDQLKVTRRFIRTGERRGDMIAVLDGLELGDRVATSGLLKLRNDGVVNISDNEELEPSADVNPSPANQ